MNENIWILNHYAGGMPFSRGGRHYCISKYLKQKGCSPVVFCSNAVHNSNAELFYADERLWHEHPAEEIDVPFVYVKGRPYVGNGKARVLNMLDYYFNVQKAAKQYGKLHGKPDVIIGSSVHPLACVAGIRLAKHFHCKKIVEIRDLWPESIVAYGVASKNNPIVKLLYRLEKWLYKKADRIIMTWPGGYDYICNQGWDRFIPKDKVVHISNGVSLDDFQKNRVTYPYVFLRNYGHKVFVYAGSIRKVNNIGLLVDAARIVSQFDEQVKILVFGDGDQRDLLEKRLRDENITNLVFMGKVHKTVVPSVLSQSYALILHNSSTQLDKYGQSQNKFFEYLAAGKPILMTYSVGHSIVNIQKCGVEISKQNASEIAEAIMHIAQLSPEEYEICCANARRAAMDYDFKVLTEKLIKIVEEE